MHEDVVGNAEGTEGTASVGSDYDCKNTNYSAQKE